jgi:hypothetical protein
MHDIQVANCQTERDSLLCSHSFFEFSTNIESAEIHNTMSAFEAALLIWYILYGTFYPIIKKH